MISRATQMSALCATLTGLFNDGDTATLIKDLKVRGTSSVLKVGTKIKNIHIVYGDHDIDCKTELGPMMLKSGFLKKILK